MIPELKNLKAPKYRLAAILFLNLLFSLNLWAVKFYSINAMLGVSSRVTNSICEDDNGFIWASSKTGILRLTDNDYRIYQLPYETAGAVVVKLIYEHAQLIAYTNNGQIFSYNTIYDRFDLLIDLGKVIKDEKFDFYNLLIDQFGNYWLALNNGLYKYHSGKLTLIDDISREKYSITWLDDLHLIIANPEGLQTLDIQSLVTKSIYTNRSFNPFFSFHPYFWINPKINFGLEPFRVVCFVIALILQD